MKVRIRVLGCPKAEADAEALIHAIWGMGGEVVREGEELTLVITCGFLGDAVAESQEAIAEEAERGPVLVVGCLPEREGKGPYSVGSLPGWAGELARVARAITRGNTWYIREVFWGKHAYLKVSEGCSRRCSFCTIPKIRGREPRHLPKEAVVEEARNALGAGVRELVLVAQDLTLYPGLPELLGELDRLPGDFWIRPMYLHPGGISRKLVDTLRGLSHGVRYLHIPIQHVSDRVLRQMRRAGGRRAVERAVALGQDFAIRTEVIVGFPTERDEDFQELMDFLREAPLARVAVFPYSHEEGTPASRMFREPDPRTVEERYREAREMAERKNLEFQRSLVGKELRVLLEGPGVGRSPYDAPEVDYRVKVRTKGDFAWVKVKGIDAEGDLIADPLDPIP